MIDVVGHNPTGRFDGLARGYAQYRPDYPARAIEWIIERLPGRTGTIIDVGCGTGISSRQLAGAGARVIGIEPNESMRVEAEAQHTPHVEYRASRAEATGLEAGCADGVVAAQAFHWFDADAALREFHRLLRAGGWLTLLWNDHDLADPFTAAYWRTHQQFTPEPNVIARPHRETGEVLLSDPRFGDAVRRDTPHVQTVDEQGLLGRAFSASFAPKECGASARFADALRELFRTWSSGGTVAIRYQTTAYQARALVPRVVPELPGA